MKTSKAVTEIMLYCVLEMKLYFITEYPNNQHVYLLTSNLYLHDDGCIKRGRGATEGAYVQVPDFSATPLRVGKIWRRRKIRGRLTLFFFFLSIFFPL